MRAQDGGELCVRLAAKADDIALEEHGVLMDPVVVPREPVRPGAEPVAVHLFGSLCLETDLITRRTVFLPRRPEPGDLHLLREAGFGRAGDVWRYGNSCVVVAIR